MSSNNSKAKKPWSLKKKVILGCTGVILAVIIGVCIYIISDILNPSLNGFATIGQMLPSATSTAIPTSAPSVSGSATATPTIDPNEALAAKGDLSGLDNIVNILLMGIDYSPERDTWKGKHSYHSDVMIVLSVNRETNQVSMISLPRDTYAQNPVDPNGIYKLNTSLNTGGDWPDPKSCEKVCDAASWMIGGLPVQYFYAVDMDAVKALVNGVQGVDFNLDISFSMQGRSYTKGQQHMDGQGVLDYLRVRKNADSSHEGIKYDSKNEPDQSGDWNRVVRQKNMLKTIFAKIKNNGLMAGIPTLISALNSGHLVTNVPLDLTTKLAGYSLKINPDDVQVYSMSGDYVNGVFGNSGYAFTFTDQNNRASILQKVYGLDINDKASAASKGIKVPDNYSDYSIASASKTGEKMQIDVTKNVSEPILDKVKQYLDADALLPAPPVPTTNPTVPVVTPPPTAPADDDENENVTANSVASIINTPSDKVSYDTTGYRKYTADGPVWVLYNTCVTEHDQLTSWDTSKTSAKSDRSAFNSLISKYQTDIRGLAGTFSIKVPSFAVIYNPFEGKINQSYVKDTIPVDFS